LSKSFYCDNCGESVESDEERCPGCGRFFRAVKCPVCDFSGKGNEFLKGCPVCGYLSIQENINRNIKKEKNKKKEFFNISRITAYFSLILLTILLVYFIYLFVKI